jgi:hypothetical protein
MSGHTPEFVQQARDWQEALAHRLAELPYPQLCELDEYRELAPPAELAGMRFAVARHGPAHDRVCVEVMEVVPEPFMPTVEAMVKALQTRHAVWFEKRSDGHVTWPKERPG